MKAFLYNFLLYFSNNILSHIPSHCLRLFFYRNFMKFKVEKGSCIFMYAWIDSKENFELGKNSVINQKCRLDNRGSIKIGDNVSISSEVCILTADHDLQSKEFKGRTRPVVIEDYVFIGTRAMVLPGVTLGKGSAVAAGAVVTKNVEPFTVVAGVPAKPIDQRTSNLNYNAHYCRLFQ